MFSLESLDQVEEESGKKVRCKVGRVLNPVFMDNHFKVKVCMGGFTMCVGSTDIQMPGSRFGAPEIIPRCWEGRWDMLKFDGGWGIYAYGGAYRTFVRV